MKSFSEETLYIYISENSKNERKGEKGKKTNIQF